MKNEKIQAFITLHDDAAINELESLGVEINVDFGNNLYTALLPLNNIDRIAQLSNIAEIALPQNLNALNDSARSASKVNLAHQGYDLPSAFNGKDVIMGVIDTGFEFHHINFKDEHGKSRILAAYLPEAEMGGKDVVIGSYTLPGRQFITDSDIATLTSDYELQSHGSHVAGTAAGSYKRSEERRVGKEC